MAERISYLQDDKTAAPPDPVRAGDVVKTGPNDYPRFKVIAVDSGRAWLRNVVSGDDAVVSLEDCCWRLDAEKGDEPIGRMRRGGGKHRIGPESPVEPRRIDRVPPPGDAPQSPI